MQVLGLGMFRILKKFRTGGRLFKDFQSHSNNLEVSENWQCCDFLEFIKKLCAA